MKIGNENCSGALSSGSGVRVPHDTFFYFLLRDGAVRSACWAHNPEVVGSNPAPASIYARQLSLVQNKSDQLG